MVSRVQNFGTYTGNPYIPSYNEAINYSLNNPFVTGNPYSQDNFSSGKNQKVGFWEGTKAFLKGVFKPIKNMILHPIKSALFIAGTAALIIGTGGAATPFLIGAGVALGGWQLAKGAVNAITSDNKAETLAALEDMGEGTFTLGASVAGAKSYAASTSAGSATAAATEQTSLGSKALTYAKGLGQDSIMTLKSVPSSLKSTVNCIASGEFTGNLQSFGASANLAAQHRNLAKLRQANSPDYATAKVIYDSNVKAYTLKYGVMKPNQIANRYMNLFEEYGFDSTNASGTRFINNPELVKVASVRALKNNANIFKNLPEVNMALAFNSKVNVDPEIQSAIQEYGQYYIN